MLTAIMVLFASVALAPEIKLVPVAIYMAGYALTRVPGIATVL